MSEHVYKTVEITGTSPVSFAEAVRGAVAKASQTLRHLDWFEVIDMRGHLADGEIDYFQVTVKVGFRLE
jgi:flavin-binding protein dodecin